MKKLLSLLMVFCAVLVVGTRGHCDQVTPITATDLESKIANSKSKVLIVDFFATWCPPCQAEIPGFIELYTKYRDKDVEIIGVSVDQGGPAVVEKFSNEKGINYPVFIGESAVAMKYGIRGIPDTRIYTTGGKQVNRHVGFTSKEEFEKEIDSLLK